MDRIYLNELLDAIGNMLRLDVDDLKICQGLLANFAGVLGFSCLYDLSHTQSVGKDQLYRAIEAMNHCSLLNAIHRHGRQHLAAHLRKIRNMSPGTQSRERVTLWADDCKSQRLGHLDGLTYFWWNGGQKQVTLGLNLQVLAGVIGDGKKILILDVRLVLPSHEGAGRPPKKKTVWLGEVLKKLNSHLGTRGLDLTECVLSVESAYVAPSALETTSNLKIPLVSTLYLAAQSHRANCWEHDYLGSKAEIWLGLRIFLNVHRTRPMTNELGVEYQRQLVEVPLIGPVLLVYAARCNDGAVLFSTDFLMKAQTMVRTARRRWQLKRVFWNLQQHLGLGQIPHTDRRKTLARVLWAVVLFVAIQKVAKKHRLSIGEFCDLLHRHRHWVIQHILLGSGISFLNLAESAPYLLAAA